MNITLNWTPAGGPNSTGQNVQLRQQGSVTWLTANDVPLGPSVSQYAISGLLDNQLYDFQIINICSFGGPIDSEDIEAALLTCPALTVNATGTSVTVSFSHLGGSIDKYVVRLYNEDNTLSSTHIINTGLTGTISYTFTDLTTSTTYKVKVEPSIGVNYLKTNCDLVVVTTSAPPTCNAPTNVIATLS